MLLYWFPIIYHMEISVDNIKEFKTYIECARAVISEDIILRFTPEYMTIKQLDNAHVNMVEINLRDTYFSGYTVEDQRDIIVDLDSLIVTIGKFEAFKTLTFSFDEKTNKLNFIKLLHQRCLAPHHLLKMSTRLLNLVVPML